VTGPTSDFKAMRSLSPDQFFATSVGDTSSPRPEAASAATSRMNRYATGCGGQQSPSSRSTAKRDFPNNLRVHGPDDAGGSPPSALWRSSRQPSPLTLASRCGHHAVRSQAPRGCTPLRAVGSVPARTTRGKVLSNYPLTPRLPAADIDRAKEWYEAKLGLTPERSEEVGQGLWYQTGGGWFYLYPTPSAGTAQTLRLGGR
jgi:hypothetical protein